MEFNVYLSQYGLKMPFGIAGKVFKHVDALIVEASEGGHTGRGEAEGIFYLGDTGETLLARAQDFLKSLDGSLTREALQSLLPPGGVRCAFDCALWDLECKSTGKSIWDLTGVPAKAVRTVFTIGLEDEPAAMAKKAAAARDLPILKIKLDGDRPLERMQLIRKEVPNTDLVVDANQGWELAQLKDVAPAFAELGVKMIEQPLARGKDEGLEGYEPPLPLCADESCLNLSELEEAAKRYQMINIKLDKTGGLTEALELAHRAREAGLGLMVGNMMGSSLSMAPAFVIAQLCDFVDIDGPLLLSEDVDHGLTYDKGQVAVPTPALWG